MTGRFRLPGVRRLGWGVTDQTISSITNFALAVVVARAVGVREFGLFGLAFTAYTSGIGLVRAACSEPLGVRFNAGIEEAWEALSDSAGTALVMGVALGLITAVVAAFIGDSTRMILLALALTFPGMMLQNVWHTAFFIANRGRSACVNDLLQLVVLVPLLIIAPASAAGYFLAFGISGSAAGVAASFQLGVWPRPLRGWAWLRATSDLGPRFVAEFLVRNVANSSVMYLTALFAGVAASGALRAGQVVLGPFNILNMGLTAVAVVEAGRMFRGSPRTMYRFATRLAVTLSATAVLCGVVAYFTPDRIGTALLGASWKAAHPVILPLATAMAATGVLTAATIGLRAAAAASRSLRARTLTGIISMAATTAGAAGWGARGAAIGLAVGLWIGAGLWWRSLQSVVEAAGARTPPPAQPEPSSARIG